MEKKRLIHKNDLIEKIRRQKANHVNSIQKDNIRQRRKYKQLKENYEKLMKENESLKEEMKKCNKENSIMKDMILEYCQLSKNSDSVLLLNFEDDEHTTTNTPKKTRSKNSLRRLMENIMRTNDRIRKSTEQVVINDSNLLLLSSE
ncbi:hypothetical protein SNEBB_004073 [Seison nebaliae]|nr:hypothetical protein SNEBB_004073 [Seison nebaliae]